LDKYKIFPVKLEDQQAENPSQRNNPKHSKISGYCLANAGNTLNCPRSSQIPSAESKNILVAAVPKTGTAKQPKTSNHAPKNSAFVASDAFTVTTDIFSKPTDAYPLSLKKFALKKTIIAVFQNKETA